MRAVYFLDGQCSMGPGLRRMFYSVHSMLDCPITGVFKAASDGSLMRRLLSVKPQVGPIASGAQALTAGRGRSLHYQSGRGRSA
jgi:hypothetical protein